MPYAHADDGARIHYEVFGRRSAPAVLMIQGLGADKHGWDLQRFGLAGQYRVIVSTTAGVGRSDKPFGDYSLEQMTDDAVAVLDEVGVDAAHVVGASMGGAIAFHARGPSSTACAVVDAGMYGVPQPTVAATAARTMDEHGARTRNGRDDS